MVYLVYFASGVVHEFFGITKDGVYLAAKELYPDDTVARVVLAGEW
jgi:hypothetical protein